MRVLLDESVPRQLGPLLEGHAVSTVEREGWGGLGNGALLREAQERFDVFVTGDQSLQHQPQLMRLLSLADVLRLHAAVVGQSGGAEGG